MQSYCVFDSIQVDLDRKLPYQFRLDWTGNWSNYIIRLESIRLHSTHPIKYHTEGSVCRIENVILDRLKSGLNLDKIEDDIEEDREGRLKD